MPFHSFRKQCNDFLSRHMKQGKFMDEENQDFPYRRLKSSSYPSELLLHDSEVVDRNNNSNTILPQTPGKVLSKWSKIKKAFTRQKKCEQFSSQLQETNIPHYFWDYEINLDLQIPPTKQTGSVAQLRKHQATVEITVTSEESEIPDCGTTDTTSQDTFSADDLFDDETWFCDLEVASYFPD